MRKLRDMLFGDSARAFGTLSAVLLALLAVVPAKDYFRDWRGYQKGYLRLIRGRGSLRGERSAQRRQSRHQREQLDPFHFHFSLFDRFNQTRHALGKRWLCCDESDRRAGDAQNSPPRNPD